MFVLDPLDTFEDPDDIVWAKEREIRRVHELIVQATTTPATNRCSSRRMPRPPGWTSCART